MDNMNNKKKTEKTLITEGVNVPTSLHRLKEFKLKGLPWFVSVAWAFFLMGSVTTTYVLVSAGTPGIPAILIPAVLFFTFGIITARNRKQFLRSYHHVLLIFRIIFKKSIFKKYKLSLDEIKKWIPVESIEDTGLVRYTDGTSMIPILLTPPRNAATDLDTYNVRLLNVVNTLYGEFSYQFYSISTNEVVDHLTKSTSDVLNEDHPTPILNHMFSIYEYALNKSLLQDIPDWDFILFVYIPRTKTIQDAELMKNSLVSGLVKEIKRAKMLSTVVDNHNDCVRLLRMILIGGK